MDNKTEAAVEASHLIELNTQMQENHDLNDEQALALPSVPPHITQPEQPAAVSTLDAIAMDNVYATLDLNSNESTSNKIDDEAMHYLAVAKRQRKEAERILVKHTFDIATDVRQLAARVLADSEKEEAIIALAQIMQDESNEKIVCEAIRSLTGLIIDGEDPANGVRLAAAQGLARLVKLEELQGFTEEVVNKMLAAAILEGGQQNRPMGQRIRATSIELGSEKLLAQLDEADNSADRRFIIEMLEELLRPEPDQKAA